MKRYSLIVCLVLIISLSGVASAQIVLGPADVGSPFVLYSSYAGTITTYTSATLPGIAFVGNSFGGSHPTYVIYYMQAAFEFNLGPAIPPTFTSNNFTARLGGLNVIDSTGTYSMNVYLYNMGDGTEDGNVYYNDFNSKQGALIASSVNVIGGVPANFGIIDVTEVVRNDLFGAGQTDFSGFILLCPDGPMWQTYITYSNTPTLTICPGGDCGDSGGGCFIATAVR